MLHLLLRSKLAFVTLLGLALPGAAQETLALRETLAPGNQYFVSSRVELSGSLTLPLEKGQTTAKTLTVTGSSAIDYHERLLTVTGSNVPKTIRLYQKLEFQRTVGEQKQQSFLRPAVKRLVILRHQQLEVPFSPDGPLTWNELDLVRTDVFTPALIGLLPPQPVRVGDKWNAATSAIQELTDLDKIEEGVVTCKLDKVALVNKRRQAQLSFTGNVRGLGEDGPARHQLDGTLVFDLESNHIAHLTMRGIQQMVDKDGKAIGKIEGTVVMTRRAESCKELADEALRPLTLEPNEDNTLLLYDNADLGVRLLHPRRWRIAGVRGRQIALDDNRGNGMLMTLEPLGQTPTAAQFLQETQTFLQQQKVKVLRVDQPKQVQAAPQAVDQFALEIEVGKDRVIMGYWVLRQNVAGATVAARILPQNLTQAWADLGRITRSVQLQAAPK